MSRQYGVILEVEGFASKRLSAGQVVQIVDTKTDCFKVTDLKPNDYFALVPHKAVAKLENDEYHRITPYPDIVMFQLEANLNDFKNDRGIKEGRAVSHHEALLITLAEDVR